jgi:N-acetylglucosaminyl-diphospho-decaprenol L-rhamnosyltransferase
VSEGAALAVITVGYNSAAQLPGTLTAVTTQLRDDDELVVVDNASSDGTVDVARAYAPRARVIELDLNSGFGGGCAAGVEASTAPLILFLNPDAAPAPGCIEALRQIAAQRPRWGAWQALVVMQGGQRVNTLGGKIHYLGFGWAGGCGIPAGEVAPDPAEVAFASGAAMVIRRKAWEAVGGFDPSYFLYGEDLDLSLRLWLAGYGVGMTPSARVEHDYEFEKGRGKWFLLERNRWRTLLAAYPAPLLLLLAPALLLFEVALLPVAAQGGWLGAKLRAQGAVLRDVLGELRRRRRVQATRRIDAHAFAELLTADLDSEYLGPAARIGPLVALQRLYWRIVRALLRRCT